MSEQDLNVEPKRPQTLTKSSQLRIRSLTKNEIDPLAVNLELDVVHDRACGCLSELECAPPLCVGQEPVPKGVSCVASDDFARNADPVVLTRARAIQASGSDEDEVRRSDHRASSHRRGDD